MTATNIVTTETEKDINNTVVVKTYDDMWNSNSVEYKVTYILRELGIGMRLSGFIYTRRAIIMIMNDPDEYSSLITKRLYVDLANEMGSSVSRVERNIRSAISSIDCNDNIKRAYIGCAKDNYTNNEFLMAIVELIKFNMK